MVSEDELQEIIDIVRDTFPVRRILLFGSYAREDAHEGILFERRIVRGAARP